MKRVGLFILVIMLVFCIATPPASAQTHQSASTTVTVNLTVAAAMAMTATAPLDFGTQLQGATSVSVNPITGGASAGMVTLTAAPASQSVTVAWTNTDITDGTTNIAWTPDLAGNTTSTQTGASTLTNGGTATVSSSGDYYIWVGGTIASIPAAAPAGAYTGTLTLTISY